MSDRRHEERPQSGDRRSFPRPPLWLNVLLLILAMATFAYAKHQRDEIRQKTAILFQPGPSNPAELNHIRSDLSDMDLSSSQLSSELDGRMKYLDSIRSQEFYIAVDTAKKKLYFRFANDVVRECDITLGEAKTVVAADKSKTWTFVPVKGAFTVLEKQSDYSWPVPEWVYAMHGERAPASPQMITNGLGHYVITLPDNYVIHTPPPPDSPLHGTAKPGSIMVPEEDLAAIWPRITNQTRVYIF